MNIKLLKKFTEKITIQIAPEDWIMSFAAAGTMFGPFIIVIALTFLLAY